jgi:hypothetical protein
MTSDTQGPNVVGILATTEAEIEAEFARAQAATRAATEAGRAAQAELRRHRQGQRFVGATFDFIRAVCQQTRGRAALAVALLIIRRTIIHRSLTVTLPGPELEALGLNRDAKRKALAQLVAAGLVRVEPTLPGHSAPVTLIWKSK